MRILILLTSSARGGAEEYAYTIAKAALANGMNVQVALPPIAQLHSLKEDFRAHGVRCHELKIEENDSCQSKINKRRGHFLRAIRTFFLLIKIKPDVVLAVLPWPNRCLGPLLACAMLRKPAAAVFQLIPFQINISDFLQRLYTWMRSRGQQWVAVSENNRTLLSHSFGVPREQVTLIYNGAIKNRLPKTNVEDLRKKLQEELHVPSSTRFLLTVGRLTPQKGYPDLLEVCPRILQEFADVRFIWVGDGEITMDLKARICGSGLQEKIFLLGYRHDTAQLMAAADLFVFPTRFEGFSIALLECMAIGLPIVASDASGVSELIQDRVHGVLCKAGDRPALFNAVCWALNHPVEMQTMAENACKQALNFTAERMERETLRLLTDLTSNRGGDQ